MTTITGTVLDLLGNAARVSITFRSLATPLTISTGAIIPNASAFTFTNAADGTFSIALEPGDYQVTYNASENTTATLFKISVPAGSTTVDISSLISSGVNTNYYAPPGSIGVVLGCPDDGNNYQVVVSLVGGIPTLSAMQVDGTGGSYKILCTDNGQTYTLGVNLVGGKPTVTLQ